MSHRGSQDLYFSLLHMLSLVSPNNVFTLFATLVAITNMLISVYRYENKLLLTWEVNPIVLCLRADGDGIKYLSTTGTSKLQQVVVLLPPQYRTS